MVCRASPRLTSATAPPSAYLLHHLAVPSGLHPTPLLKANPHVLPFPAGGPKKPKQPRKNEGNDKLDRLAAEYRAKFFDGGSKKSGAKAGGGTQPEKSALKRWFD